jgi:hypothetical protein
VLGFADILFAVEGRKSSFACAAREASLTYVISGRRLCPTGQLLGGSAICPMRFYVWGAVSAVFGLAGSLLPMTTDLRIGCFAIASLSLAGGLRAYRDEHKQKSVVHGRERLYDHAQAAQTHKTLRDLIATVSESEARDRAFVNALDASEADKQRLRAAFASLHVLTRYVFVLFDLSHEKNSRQTDALEAVWLTLESAAGPEERVATCLRLLSDHATRILDVGITPPFDEWLIAHQPFTVPLPDQPSSPSPPGDVS